MNTTDHRTCRNSLSSDTALAIDPPLASELAGATDAHGDGMLLVSQTQR